MKKTVYREWFKKTTGNIQIGVSEFDGGLASREGFADPNGLPLLRRHCQSSFRDSTYTKIPLSVNVAVSI